MNRVWAWLAAAGAIIAAFFSAFALGGRSTANKRDADEAKANLETFKRSDEAQDEMANSSDDDITRFLRDRSGK